MRIMLRSVRVGRNQCLLSASVHSSKRVSRVVLNTGADKVSKQQVKALSDDGGAQARAQLIITH